MLSRFTLLCLPLALGACAFGRDLAGSPPDDIRFLRPGLYRTEVEERLGPPRASMRTEAGAEEVQYVYSRGIKPSTQPVLDVVGYAAVNYFTVGLYGAVNELSDCTDVYMRGALRVTYEPETQTVSHVCKAPYPRDAWCYRRPAKINQYRLQELERHRLPSASDTLPTCT